MQARSHPSPAAAPTPWKVIRALLVVNLLALVATYFSGHWDAAEHRKGAVDRFWYPPHYGIYLGLLVALLVALVGLVIILRGPGLPFEKLRRNPALTLLVIANGLNFSGAPFDAWWHAVFGIDLTIWSPPHLHLLLGMLLAMAGCMVYFLDDEAVTTPLQPLGRPTGRALVVLGALLLNVLQAVFLFIEYEMGTRGVIATRPAWTFPLAWTIFALFVLAYITAITRRIGTATLITGLYVLARIGVNVLNQRVFDVSGLPFYPLIVPALVFDGALLLAWRRGLAQPSRRALLGIGLLTTGVVAVTTPLYWWLLNVSPDLQVQPWLRYWPLAIIAGSAATLIGWWAGTGLRRLRPAEAAPVPTVEQAAFGYSL